jgi:hypothetical protein
VSNLIQRRKPVQAPGLKRKLGGVLALALPVVSTMQMSSRCQTQLGMASSGSVLHCRPVKSGTPETGTL